MARSHAPKRWLALLATALLVPILAFASPGAGATSAPAGVTNPHSRGGLTLFSATGQPVTSGSDLSHLADYAQADYVQAGSATAVAASTTTAGTAISKAGLLFALPSAAADASAWQSAQASAMSAFPLSGLGASLDAPTVPAVALTPTDADLTAFLGQAPQAATRQVEVRLVQYAAAAIPAGYWTAELNIDTTAGTWTVQQPPAMSAATAQTAQTVPVWVSAIGIRPQPKGVGVTITSEVVAADGTHPAGVVELFDRTTRVLIGSYNQADGSVSVTGTPPDGQHQYRFEFLPRDTSHYATAGSAVFFCSAQGGLITSAPTSLALRVVPPANGTAFGTTTLTSWLRPAGATGSVTFIDSANGPVGTVLVTGGVARLLTNALGKGVHTITAVFTPTSCTPFGKASATAEPFSLSGADAHGDAQTVNVSVNPGQLTITTPYNAAHPFKLGDLVLSANGSKLFASGHFGTAADAARTGITVTDTRIGDQPWTASVASTNFVSGANTINAQNLGFVNVHPQPVPGDGGGNLGGSMKPVLTFDLPADTVVDPPNDPGSKGLAGSPRTFATAAHGGGSVYLFGDLVLNAPTTTLAGNYTATLTFTVG